MTELRAFKDSGLSEFRAYLERLKNEPSLAPPNDLLTDFRYSEPVRGGARIEQHEFRSKLDFGRYIANAIGNRVSESFLRRSVGMWAWLVLFYFDQVCPLDGNGRRKVLRMEKYLPSAGHIATGLDKHLLFFPWKMVALHGDAASWLLGGPLREDTKVVRELANSYRRNVSSSFLQLAESLYFDAQKKRLRTGATTNRAGSLRRLDRVVNQLDLTYDVFGMDANELRKVLPPHEFRRWLQAHDTATSAAPAVRTPE